MDSNALSSLADLVTSLLNSAYTGTILTIGGIIKGSRIIRPSEDIDVGLGEQFRSEILGNISHSNNEMIVKSPILLGALNFFLYEFNSTETKIILTSNDINETINKLNFNELLKQMKTDAPLRTYSGTSQQSNYDIMINSPINGGSLYDLFNEPRKETSANAWIYSFKIPNTVYGTIGFYFPTTKRGLSIVLTNQDIQQYIRDSGLISVKNFITALLNSQKITKMPMISESTVKEHFERLRQYQKGTNNWFWRNFDPIYRKIINFIDKNFCTFELNNYNFNIIELIQNPDKSFEAYRNNIKNLHINSTGDGIFFYALATDNAYNFAQKELNSKELNSKLKRLEELEDYNNIIEVSKLDNTKLFSFTEDNGFILRPYDSQPYRIILMTDETKHLFKPKYMNLLSFNGNNNAHAKNFIYTKLPHIAVGGALAGTVLSSSIYKQWAEEFCNLHPIAGPILRPILQNPKTSLTIIGTLIGMKQTGLAKKLLDFFNFKKKSGEVDLDG